MGTVNADRAILAETVKRIQAALVDIQNTNVSLTRKYQLLGQDWNDRRYQELGMVLAESRKAMISIYEVLRDAGSRIYELSQSLQEYDDVSLTSGVLSRHISTDEVNFRWKETMGFVDEQIRTYHSELIAHGVCDGALLQRFLAVHRSRMLQYEAEVLNVASGSRPPLNEDEIYHYVLVGENSPYSYDCLRDEFGSFCLDQINSWIQSINPNPDHDPRRSVNCGKCAAAVFHRLNGNNSATADLGTYSISEMNSITGRTQTTMTPQQIENYLRTQGAGSHVVVGVDRDSGAGHWFNAFFDGNNVYTIDGQGGTMEEWPPDYSDPVLGNVTHWDASI